jgi:hypothetical protein
MVVSQRFSADIQSDEFLKAPLYGAQLSDLPFLMSG